MMNDMKKILAIIAIIACASFDLQAQRLTILHLNDTHSHIEPVRSGQEYQEGGVIERAAFVDSVRKADGRKNVLLLHAGDFSQGTSYFTIFHGDLEISLMNAQKYDVVTLGNHEFDNGIEELTRRVKKLKCPLVCCNYDFSTFELGKYVKPYAIIHKAGLKIGVIGVLTDISSVVSRQVVEKLPQLDAVVQVNKYAEYLKKEKKCDMVIALTHIGYTGEGLIDPVLASKTRNVDLFVGGHSHTFLKKIEHAENLDGKQIPIVTDGCWGLYVGELKLN